MQNNPAKEDSSAVAGSFRDRRARVYINSENVFRGLDDVAYGEWKQFSDSGLFQDLQKKGQIASTEEIPLEKAPSALASDKWSGALKHEKIPFISYPYEWSFEQLKDAALFHLDILSKALEKDFILKDSSAYNVQWRGCKPVFIDIASFEKLKPSEPWVGYKQFCEMFLNPLLLTAHKGVDFQPWVRGNIDGIDTTQIARLFSWRDYIRRGVFTHVILHAKLQGSMKSSSVSKSSITKSGFGKGMIVSNVEAMKGVIKSLEQGGEKSHWVDYNTTHSYTDDDYGAKAGFIKNVCEKVDGNLVWDVGCNTGDFSRIAAGAGAYVIAMDSDYHAVSALYERSKKEGVHNILPLCVNLVDPSPSQGWRLEERLGLERRQKPDLILALALIHHIVIGSNVPTADFVNFLASTGAAVALEFVSKKDEMVQALLKNKEDIYDDYSEENLERNLERYFDIREKLTLKNGLRSLFFVAPK